MTAFSTRNAARQPGCRRHGMASLGELAAGLFSVALLCVVLSLGERSIAVAGVVYLVVATLVARHVPTAPGGLGWANRVTLIRAILVCVLAGSLADPAAMARPAWPLAGLALTALALDGVDGWVAQRTGTTSEFGARFDMEVDTFFILVLCLALVAREKVGPWVLAVGAMRYAFLLAAWRWHWLNAPLPESRRRKSVCVWQVAALLTALLPIVGETTSVWLAATALAGLTMSFAIDVRWLHGRANA